MKTRRLFPLLALLSTLGPVAHGAVLMIDFGLTTVTGAGPLVNSPYHEVSSGVFTDTSWNQVQTADPASLVYSDGTAATGLALNLGGTGDDTSTTIALTNQPDTSSALGGTTNTNIYASPSVGRDGIFEGTTQFVTRRVGFQLTGLAAGTYDLYVGARNTSAAPNAYTQTVYAAAGATGDFSYTGFDNKVLAFAGDNTATESWVENSNYVKLTVTLTEGQALNLAVAGAGQQTRGFLNFVQIVAVPEPGATGFLGLGALAVMGIARRRRGC